MTSHDHKHGWHALLPALGAVLILVVLLVLTQWMSRAQIPVVEWHEVDTVDVAKLAEPDSTLPEEIAESAPAFTPPPTSLELEISPETPVLPAATLPTPSLDVSLEMTDFALNQPALNVQALPDPKPAPPQVTSQPVPRITPRPAPKSTPPRPRQSLQIKPVPRPKPKPARRSTPTPPPPLKTSYNASELDGRPQLRGRKPVAPFPRKLAKAGVTEGTAILNVEIDTAGRVRVLGIASISHPELKPMAMQVARKARFTKPTKDGRPVKARFRWPLRLKK